MVSVINYEAIMEELKLRFSALEEKDADVRQVGAQMCMRMVHFLDVDPTLTPEEVILQLEDKWRSEGLISSGRR